MPSTLADFRFAPSFDVAVASRVGVGPATRSENQDNLVVIDFDGRACHLHDQRPVITTIAGWPTGHGRLAVLDGMGGHGHGREAAEALAAGLVLHAMLQAQFADGAGATGRPGTTLTLLELPPGAAPLLYHVGDSRLYELDAKQATALTVDHVPATGAALAGRLGEADWWREVHGRHAPQIAQAFILGNAFADPSRLSDGLFALTPANLPCWLAHLPDRRALQLRADAAYLLATDGFWSCAQPDRFVARWPVLLADAPAAATLVERLFGLMEHEPPAGLQPDNLTALVLRPLPRHADETALPLEDDGASY